MSGTSVLFWFLLSLAVIGVGVVLIALARRSVRKRLRGEEHTDIFTMQDLREMRDAGQINQVEFEAMRAAIIAQVSAGSTPETQSNARTTDTSLTETNDDPSDSPPNKTTD